MTAAVCLRTGNTLRVLDSECAAISDLDPVAAWLTGSDRRSRMEQAPLLHAERYLHARRARLILDRAERFPRYREAIVYPEGGGCGPIRAEELAAILHPIAAQGSRVVADLLARITEPLLPDLVITGGNAIGPVVSAIARTAAAVTDSVRIVPPWSAAVGARRIAAGEIRVDATFPNTIGLLAHRTHHGRLESVVLPVPAAETTGLAIEVADDQEVGRLVRIRDRGVGPWLEYNTVDGGPRLPAGRYEVNLLTRRTAHGALQFRDIATGAIHRAPLRIRP
ncbi:hypothetical protein ACWDSJ_36980 [Nocardia sp. NPDC003482]